MKFHSAAVLLIVTSAASALATPPTYRVVPIQVPNSLASGAMGISDTGRVIGWSIGVSGRTVWKRSPTGVITSLGGAGDTEMVNTAVDNPEVTGYISNNGRAIVSHENNLGGVTCRTFSPTGAATRISGQTVFAGGVKDNGTLAYSKIPEFAGVPQPPFSLPAYTSTTAGTTMVQYLPQSGNAWLRQSFIHGMNSLSTLVGYSLWVDFNQTGGIRAATWTNGQIHVLPMPAGHRDAKAHAIANNGIVIGAATYQNDNAPDGLGWRCVMWDATGPTVVQSRTWSVPSGYFRCPLVRPWDVNSGGRAVGVIRYVLDTGDVDEPYSDDDLSQVRGFLIDDHVMYDLNGRLLPNSGWRIKSATGINDNGVIAATAVRNGQYTSQAVLLVPQ